MQDLDAYLTSLSDKANFAKSEKYKPSGMANGNILHIYFFVSIPWITILQTYVLRFELKVIANYAILFVTYVNHQPK